MDTLKHAKHLSSRPLVASCPCAITLHRTIQVSRCHPHADLRLCSCGCRGLIGMRGSPGSLNSDPVKGIKQ